MIWVASGLGGFLEIAARQGSFGIQMRRESRLVFTPSLRSGGNGLLCRKHVAQPRRVRSEGLLCPVRVVLVCGGEFRGRKFRSHILSFLFRRVCGFGLLLSREQ